MSRFAAVGHVTSDRILGSDGAAREAPGGSALYAGLAAARLGARAHVVTSCADGAAALARLAGAGVKVTRVPADATTTFENDYRGPARAQRLVARAAPLVARASAARIDAAAVLVCPVAGEIEGPAPAFAAPGARVGVGLQGFLRAVDPDGRVRPLRGLDAAALAGRLAGCDVAFVSTEDLGADPRGELDEDAAALARALERAVPLLVVTRGARGAVVHHGGARLVVPAAPAREVDPTGAGDLFATAMLLALAAGADARAAAIEGACAGAIAVEAVGPDAVEGLGAMDPRRAAWRAANG